MIFILLRSRREVPSPYPYELRSPVLDHGFFQFPLQVMRGLVATPMENQDQFISGEVTNHLFEERAVPFSGLDLAALNIQRGRDHGLRPYNEYRASCNLQRANDFSDLGKEINTDVIKRLRQVSVVVGGTDSLLSSKDANSFDIVSRC